MDLRGFRLQLVSIQRRPNDLWEFNLATQESDMGKSGSNSGNQSGVYGTEGVPSTNNIPGARTSSAGWIDTSGNLWIFGGYGYTSNPLTSDLNDLWKFNPNTQEWTWVSGNYNPVGVYGTEGVPSTSNIPGDRQYSVTWTNISGSLWLFGEEGLAPAGNGFGVNGYLNDLWNFNPTTQAWTWASGCSCVGQSGVFGTEGVPSPNNIPGARTSSAGWMDTSNNLWLFGGFGYASNTSQGYLNDLWKFNTTTQEWTWVSGNNVTNQSGVYGTEGVPFYQ